ncbi:MAG: HEAT repeat domain-containing protein [Planctomycetota bacterium]
MRRGSYALICLLAAGCSAPGPERLPSPKRGLYKAREATHSGTPAERAAAHRRVIELCLEEGWSDEAAQDYLALRELSGEDAQLLETLAWGTLRFALRSSDPARRIRGAEALSRLVPNPVALQLLRDGLGDPHPEVQVACVSALGRAGWGEALATLERAEACDPAAQRAALDALSAEARGGRVAPEALAAALPGAAASLERGPDRVRLAALELLALLGDPGAEALAQGIEQADEAVSQRAAVLFAARDAEDARARWRRTHLGRTPELAAFDRALGVHAGASAGPVADDLASEDPAVRHAALRGLWGPGAATLGAEIHALTEHPSRATRLAALALARRWAPLPRPALLGLLGHEDPATRLAGFTALSAGETLGLDVLEPLWTSGDRALAPVVAECLLGEGPRGLELLERGVARPATSRAALRALQARPEAHPRFRALLEVTDPDARRLGARGLVYSASRADVPQLVEGLTTLRADTDVLCAAALLSALEVSTPPSVE